MAGVPEVTRKRDLHQPALRERPHRRPSRRPLDVDLVPRPLPRVARGRLDTRTGSHPRPIQPQKGRIEQSPGRVPQGDGLLARNFHPPLHGSDGTTKERTLPGRLHLPYGRRRSLPVDDRQLPSQNRPCVRNGGSRPVDITKRGDRTHSILHSRQSENRHLSVGDASNLLPERPPTRPGNRKPAQKRDRRHGRRRKNHYSSYGSP